MQTITSPTTTAIQGVVVRSDVKAGFVITNHAEGVVVRSAVKAGFIIMNHAEGIADPKPASATTESAELDGGIIHEASGEEGVTGSASASAPATEPAGEDALVIEY